MKLSPNSFGQTLRFAVEKMDLRESINDQTDVALGLAKHVLLSEAKSTNSVLSPLSLQAVLSLIAAGSKGPTLQQLLSYLKSKSGDQLHSLSSQLVSVVLADGSPNAGPLLSFSNGVWVDKSLSLKHSFKQVVEISYKAASNQVDFQTKASEVTNEVNAWAEKETNGLIKEVLPAGSVDSNTRLVLTNAVYFKGAWKDKFDAARTKEDDFWLLNGSSVRVPFMTSRKKQFAQAFEGFKVLKLPYNQGDDKRQFSMYFFLPDAKDGLPALVDKMDAQSGFLDRHLPLQEVEVGNFRIPKFNISFGFEASKTFKELGLVLPFSGEGDLTEMVDSDLGQKLYVSRIFHKSFIGVNEEGTEAGAASAGVIKLRGLPLPAIDFVADHPFLFLIREDMTGVVLFIGHVLKPSQEA
ncbi:hypothetical protein K2173_007507 [Erythroxylum novogranatense]|uniref:Serpin domain-containing protein n=1 Tax=Erythroxylum novogranatense TaxID=1862640 RepID=A0AAV8T7N7_9ROSI|nr:hypothetical protein K2173_007507 [Erythroxylum novogranatense]